MVAGGEEGGGLLYAVSFTSMAFNFFGTAMAPAHAPYLCHCFHIPQLKEKKNTNSLIAQPETRQRQTILA